MPCCTMCSSLRLICDEEVGLEHDEFYPRKEPEKRERNERETGCMNLDRFSSEVSIEIGLKSRGDNRCKSSKTELHN